MPLAGTSVTSQEALVAIEALAVSIEVMKSRIEDWRIEASDTISDNASYGEFTLGSWSQSLREAELRTLGTMIHRNGLPVVEGTWAAAPGGLSRSVAWLARTLKLVRGKPPAGPFVISGSLGKTILIQQGAYPRSRVTVSRL